MKKAVKIVYSIFICSILISSFTCVLGAGLLNNMKPDPSRFSDYGLANSVIGALRVIGYFIAVGAVVVIGIKYIQASADEKADLKSAFPKYLVGAVLIIFAVEIIGLVFSTVGGGS